jgi:hypothetical protein
MRNDSVVVDFIVSSDFTSEPTQFLNPTPPQAFKRLNNTLKTKFHSMHKSTKCNNDSDIKQIVGIKLFSIAIDSFLKSIIFNHIV